jgi:hypothetical protein
MLRSRNFFKTSDKNTSVYNRNKLTNILFQQFSIQIYVVKRALSRSAALFIRCTIKSCYWDVSFADPVCDNILLTDTESRNHMRIIFPSQLDSPALSSNETFQECFLATILSSPRGFCHDLVTLYCLS